MRSPRTVALACACLWFLPGCNGESRQPPSSPAQTTTIPVSTANPCARVTGPASVPFFVYADGGDPRNHFIASGFFGDTADLAINQTDSTNPHSGSTSLRIDYRPRGAMRFAGVFWQCPESNFGTVADAGFNLTLAQRVRFFARASRPSRAEFKVGGIGRASPPQPFPDSLLSTSTSPVIVELGTDWREFTISVAAGDRSRIIGGFLFVTNTDQNQSDVSIWVDDVVWE
jgi:hypothetical protein